MEDSLDLNCREEDSRNGNKMEGDGRDSNKIVWKWMLGTGNGRERNGMLGKGW